METADVRKRVRDAMTRAKQRAADRRTHVDASTRAFDRFLNQTAIPLMRQIANVLRAEGYQFSVGTPSGSVRLVSDTSNQDLIEIFLDAAGDAARVVGHVSHSRGRRVIDAEHVVAQGDPEAITEDELLTFLLKELEPFVER